MSASGRYLLKIRWQRLALPYAILLRRLTLIGAIPRSLRATDE
jgi:hypothetical protein